MSASLKVTNIEIKVFTPGDGTTQYVNFTTNANVSTSKAKGSQPFTTKLTKCYYVNQIPRTSTAQGVTL